MGRRGPFAFPRARPSCSSLVLVVVLDPRQSAIANRELPIGTPHSALPNRPLPSSQSLSKPLKRSLFFILSTEPRKVQSSETCPTLRPKVERSGSFVRRLRGP